MAPLLRLESMLTEDVGHALFQESLQYPVSFLAFNKIFLWKSQVMILQSQRLVALVKKVGKDIPGQLLEAFTKREALLK